MTIRVCFPWVLACLLFLCLVLCSLPRRVQTCLASAAGVRARLRLAPCGPFLHRRCWVASVLCWFGSYISCVFGYQLWQLGHVLGIPRCVHGCVLRLCFCLRGWAFQSVRVAAVIGATVCVPLSVELVFCWVFCWMFSVRALYSICLLLLCIILRWFCVWLLMLIPCRSFVVGLLLFFLVA